jgi:hypothetical protein
MDISERKNLRVCVSLWSENWAMANKQKYDLQPAERVEAKE